MKLLFHKVFGIGQSFFSDQMIKNFRDKFDPLVGSELHGNWPLENYFTNVAYQLAQARETKKLDKPFIETIWGFNDLMTEVWSPIISSKARKVVRDSNGNVLAIQSPVSKIRKHKRVIARARANGNDDIGAGSFLVENDIRIGGVFSKVDLKKGNVSKTSSEFTELENSDFLIQRAFWQRLMQQEQSALLQLGVMADRRDTPLFDFKENGKGYKILPVTQDNKLDRKKLKSQWLRSNRAYYKQTEVTTIRAWKDVLRENDILAQEELNKIKDINQLDSVLRKLKLSYDNISVNSDLVKNVMLVEGPNSIAIVHPDVVNALNVFRSPEEQPLVDAWNKLLSKHLGNEIRLHSVEDIENFLEVNSKDSYIRELAGKITSKESEATGAVIDNFGSLRISKVKTKPIKELDNPGSIAHRYLELVKDNFYNYLSTVGFTSESLDKKTLDGIKSKLPEEVKSVGKKGVNTTKAYKALVDLYFYNQSTLGQEALRVMTGGTFQYKQNKDPQTLFPINKYKTTEDILAKAESLTGNGKLTLDEIANKYGKGSRLVWIKAVLDSHHEPDKKADLLLVEDIGSGMDPSFIDQLKRNMAIGSIGQKPAIVGKNDYGLKLTESSKNILIDDPEAYHTLISSQMRQAINSYDAAQLAHPLYFLKLNHSLGDKESNFTYSGAPVKDFTHGVTINGYTVYQKKASFGMFTNELLKNGTAELNYLFKKMNSTVKFDEVVMVPVFNDGGVMVEDYVNDIDDKMWMQNGVSLGKILDTDTNQYITAEQLLNAVRNGRDVHSLEEYSLSDFKEDLTVNKRFKTNRVSKRFKNLQEMWEYFGSINNPTAWDDVGYTIGNYAGLVEGEYTDASLELHQSTYPLRDAYIEKIGFVTGEKTGNRNTLPATAMTSPFNSDSDFSNRFTEVSNDNHVVILQAEHQHDTTAADARKLGMEQDEELKNNTIALITQVISANVLQGRSVAETDRIGEALGVLSEALVAKLRNSMKTAAKEFVVEESKDDPSVDVDKLNSDIDNYFRLYETVSLSDPKQAEPFLEQFSSVLKYIDKGYRSEARKMLEDNISTKKDPGVFAELIDMKYDSKLSYDLKQILPLVQSLIYSKFNKEGVRYRFAGGLFVVAPSEHLYRTYTVGDEHNLTRSELNDLLYSLGDNADVLGYGLEELTLDTLLKHNLSDNLQNRVTHVVRSIVDIRKELFDSYGKEMNEVDAEGKLMYVDFDDFANRHITKNYETRLNSIGTIADGPEYGGEGLRWQRYITTTAEGKEIEFKETDEFKSFLLANNIPTTYLDDSTKIEPLGTKIKEGEQIPLEQMGAAYFLGPNKKFEGIPKTLAKIYYFSEYSLTGNTPVERTKGIETANIRALRTNWTSSEEAAFEDWFNASIESDTGIELANTLYKFAYEHGREISNNLKVIIEHTLEDNDKKYNWVTKPAEFYLPSLHEQAFLIKPDDTIRTFLGGGEQPDVDLLISAGIINSAEAWDLERNFTAEAVDALKTPNMEEYKLGLLEDYKESKLRQNSHLTDTLRNRVDEWVEEQGFFNFENTIKKAKNNNKNLVLSVLNSVTVKLLKLSDSADGIKKGDRKVRGSALFTAYSSIAKDLEKLSKRSLKWAPENQESAIKDILKVSTGADESNTASNIFKQNKIAAVAGSFTTALEFITARIPAQGKQSYIAGKIKNFIHSTKNSSYGPLDLLPITGADYDIDKQNIMSWSVDVDGNIVTWKEYTDLITADQSINKVPSSEVLEARILDGKDRINKEYNAKRAEAVSKKLDLEEVLNKREAEVVAKFENAEYENFASAVQNSVVFNLLQTIKAPVNAMEAATPITMRTLKGLTGKKDYTKLGTTSTVRQLLAARNHTFIHDPGAIIRYEKIVGDGKSGIGIFASDLKAYNALVAAIYKSNNIDDIDNIIFTSFFENIPVKSSGLINKYVSRGSSMETYMEEHGEKYNKEAIYFVKFTEDAEGNKIPLFSPLTTFANVGKVINNDITNPNARSIFTYGKASEYARNIKEEIKNLPEEEQIQELLKHTSELGMFDDMLVEKQAWADLSELLSAATDNAKELILGEIGANNTTNGVISTMVRMGVSLGDAISLIQEINNSSSPKVRGVFKSVVNSKDIRYKPKKGERLHKTLSGALLDALPKNPPTSAESLLSNPLYRLLPFVKIQEEFSTWSSILKINQGLPVEKFESWRWIANIEQSINRAIKDHPKTAKNKFVFNMETFIKEAKSSGRESNYVNQAIEIYNSAKTALNIPFLLYKSPQYFSYILALIEAKNTLNQIASVNNLADKMIRTAMDRERLRVSSLKDKDYNNVLDYIHGLAVDMYLNTEKGKVVNLYGTNFNLALVEDEGDVKGRLSFVQMMPEIIQTAQLDMENQGKPINSFLESLRSEPVMVDYDTQTDITVIKGQDLQNITSNRAAELKLSMNNLKSFNPTLYDALFQYSLVTNRGQYGAGTFSSLIDPDTFIEYSAFLRQPATMEALEKELIDPLDPSKYESFIVNNRALIQTKKTNKSYNLALKKKKSDDAAAKMQQRSGEDTSQQEDERQQALQESQYDDEVTQAVNIKRSGFDRSKLRDAYYIDYLRSEKLKDIKSTKGHKWSDIIVSEENGIIYKWNNDLQNWVPYIQKYPRAVIPYRSNVSSLSARVGSDYGWVVKNGNYKLEILSYVDEGYKEMIIKGKVKELEDYTAEWFNDIERKGNEFYVVRENGVGYKIIESSILRDTIKQQAPSYALILDGPRMDLSYTAGLRIPNLETTTTYYKKGKFLYQTPPKGKGVTKKGKGVTKEVFKHSPVERAKAIYTAMVYDKKFFEDIVSDIKKNNGDGTRPLSQFDMRDVDRVHADLRHAIIEAEMKILMPTMSDATIELNIQAGVRADANKERYTSNSTYNKARALADNLLPENMSNIVKLNLAMNHEKVLRSILPDNVELDTDGISFPKEGTIPTAVLEILSEAKNMTGFTVSDLKKFLADFAGYKKFATYLHEVFLNPDKSTYTILEDENNRVFINKEARFNLSLSQKVKNDILNAGSVIDPITGKDRAQLVMTPGGLNNQSNQIVTRQILDRLATHFNEIFPDTTFEVSNTIAMRRNGIHNAERVRAYVKDGTVIINTDLVTMNTPLHEYTHIYFEYLKWEDRPLFNKLITEALQSPIRSELETVYTGLNEADLGQEILAELVARKMGGDLTEHITHDNVVNSLSTGGIFGKIRRFFRWLFGGAFNTEKEIDLTMNDSLNTIIEKIGNKLVYNKGSILGDFSQTTITAVDLSKQGSHLDLKAAKALLEEMGYIRYICS